MKEILPEEFFDAEAPMGETRRYQHPGCSDGKDRALVITRMHDGWIWFCHRCGNGGKKFAKGLDPHSMLKWVRSSKVQPIQTEHAIDLPEDYTLEIPNKGKAWLYTKGITDKEMALYNIGYSRTLDRVIFPVYFNGELIYWTGRYLGIPDKVYPKWNNVRSKRTETYFKVVRGHGDSIVLVEDIISAIKVGRITDCYALLSINVSDALMFDLYRYYTTVYLWLDKDKWGKMNLYTLRYRSFGMDVRPIRTKHDPKLYTDKEIRCAVFGTDSK